MSVAKVIPLNFWQDPQEDVLLFYSERQCSVYFACWLKPGEPADYIGHLTFESASEVRSARREHPPYQIPDHSHHSYILEIPESDFLRQYIAFRNACSPTSHLTERHHYVVVGHDIYHEILAASFVAATIPSREVTDTALRRLITGA